MSHVSPQESNIRGKTGKKIFQNLANNRPSMRVQKSRGDFTQNNYVMSDCSMCIQEIMSSNGEGKSVSSVQEVQDEEERL